MRVILQRASKAQVTVNKKIVGKINQGLLVLAGFEPQDTQEDMQWMAKKITQIRIFNDQNSVMNLSVQDIGGDILLVSQFTLHALTKKGNRPSYTKASKSTLANNQYQQFVTILEQTLKKPIQTGVFGADMQVQLTNNGPVTIAIDSKNKE